jgi:hypothetical protein
MFGEKYDFVLFGCFARYDNGVPLKARSKIFRLRFL